MDAVAIASDRNTCTIDQVSGVITSGIGSPTLVLVHRKSPARLSFHGSRAGAVTVIGRACRMNRSAPWRHHSTSIGVPYSSSTRTPSAARRLAWLRVRLGRLCQSTGTGTFAVPSLVRTVITDL